MSVDNGITNTRSFVPSPLPLDIGTSNMLQTMVTRRRLPAIQDQQTPKPTFKYFRRNDGTWATRQATLDSFPANVDFNFLQLTNYKAWCVEHYRDDVPDNSNAVYNCYFYYTCSGPVTLYHETSNLVYSVQQLNKVNYILNHKGTNSDTDIQWAIWTVLGQSSTNSQLITDANNNPGFVPDPNAANEVVGVILQPTNSATMLQSLVLEAPLSTNNAVKFAINQPVANGNYNLMLWLAESEADNVRKLNFKVEGSTVATNAFNVPSNQWQRFGSYATAVSDGSLTIEVSSPVQGDPVLMGFAVYTTNFSTASISITPSSLSLCPGQNGAFTTSLSGTGPFGYQWKKNGNSLVGETHSSLSFANVSAADAGLYNVVATGLYDSATNSATLTVWTNMTATGPANAAACPGSTASFTNTASGTGPFSYVWRKGGALLSQTTSVLSITNVTAADAATYCVEVSGLCSSVTNCATLTVWTNTTVSGPLNAAACPGSTVSFTNTASGTGPFSYVWRKGGALLSQTTSVLSITNVTAADAATYCVEVSGLCSSVTNCATLTVWTNATATGPSGAAACPGSTASFTNTASGTGPFSYVWRKGGALLSQTTSVLSITNVTAADAATYCVEVSGLCGSVTNCATLTVWTNASAIGPSNAAVCPGSIVSFTNIASGTGPFSYVWRKDGEPLSQTTSVLSITNVTAADAATYCVEVSGLCGSVTNCATLTVWTNISVSTPPVDVSATPGSSATFSVTATGTGLTYQWYKGTTPFTGQTGSSLAFAHVTPPDAGSYCVATRGTCNSLTNCATLTVLCLPRATNMIGWWQGEGNGYDAIAGHNGAMFGSVTFTTNGVVGQAFSFHGGYGRINVPDEPALNFGSNQDFSIEAWINPSNTIPTYVGVRSIVDKRFAPDDTRCQGYEFAFIGSNLLFHLSDSIANNGIIWMTTNLNIFDDGKFHHVAVTLQRNATNGGHLFLDGQPILTFDATSEPGDLSNGLPLHIGNHATPYRNCYFEGGMDEVGLYDRALSADEIQAIYCATNLGRCGVAPSFVVQPSNQVATAGNELTLFSAASGTSPLAYQWLFNSNAVANATNPALGFLNLTTNDSGYYSVRATNTLGVATATNALLTVLQPICTPAPTGLVSWWRAESNGLDAVFTNDCSLYNVAFDAGKVGLAFTFDGYDSAGVAAASPSLDVGAGGGLSLECWAKPADTSTPYPLAGWYDEFGAVGADLWVNTPEPGSVQARFYDADGNHYAIFSGPDVISASRFKHLVLTYDKTNGVAMLYINGAVVISQPLGHFNPITSYDFYLGFEPSSEFFGSGSSSLSSGSGTNFDGASPSGPSGPSGPNSLDSGTWYAGLLDEVSLYNRSLAPQEILALYNAGSAGKCPPTGPLLNIQITSPTNNQLFVFSPTNILITATGYTRVGTITNVSFYTNGSFLGSIPTNQLSTNLYQLLWTNVLASTNAITVWATNSFGAFASATVTNIVVNAMPSVSILTPSTNFASYLEVTNVLLQATNYDSDGTVTNVVFRCDGTNLLGTISSNNSVWSLTWSNRVSGAYAITAVATDNRQASSSSEIRVFEVTPTNTAPTVWITYPTTNMVFPSGADITITATNINGSGSVTNVVFFVGTNLLGSDLAAPYSVTKCCWGSGTYVLRAKAFDDLGASAISSNITITVADPPLASGGSWDDYFGNPGLVDPGHFRYATAAALAVNKAGQVYVGGESFGDEGVDPEFFPDDNIFSLIKWDGNWWSGIYDTNLPSHITALKFIGDILYVAGFSNDPVVVKWDGSTWMPVGGAITSSSGRLAVTTIASIGSDIFVAGNFTGVENTSVQHIARLVGTNWIPVGNGLTLPTNGAVRAIASLGNEIYIGGDFTAAGGNTNIHHIARLAGNTWTNLGLGINATVHALTACGDDLFVGGEFSAAGSNTNVGCIARWDGATWSPIGQGVSGVTGGLQPPTQGAAVLSITLHGRDLYAGGRFTTAYNGDVPLTVNNVARATWSEETQSWTWHSLDGGLIASGYWWGDYAPYVAGTALFEGSGTNALDLYVCGVFNYAGGVPSPLVAKWRGGAPSTNSPTLTITGPANFAAIEENASFTLEAVPGNLGTNSADYVYYILDDDQIIGVGSPTSSYSATAYASPAGIHKITARLFSNQEPIAYSKPIYVSFTNASISISPGPDSFTIVANSPAQYLPVLTNDLPSSGLRISEAGETLSSFVLGSSGLGTVGVSYDRNYLVYTPLANMYGRDVLYYNVTNSSGDVGQAFVSIRIAAKPEVSITQPPHDLVVTPPASFTISGSAVDWDGAVTDLKLYTNGVQYGSSLSISSSNTFSTAWSNSAPGFYIFVAVATDNEGYTNASVPITIQLRLDPTNSPNNHPPIAAITSPTATLNGLGETNAIVVRDGQLTLTGSAYDVDGDSVSYKVVLLDANDTPLYNVTPAPRNPRGFHDGAVTNGSLGTLDLSLVENGAYTLALIVRGGGDEADATLPVAISSNLKIGQFSFSEQDLVLPVNGIPLTVTRTYNSLNPRSADFGYSWTMALNAMDIQLDDQRQYVTIGTPEAPFADDEEDDSGLPKVVSIRTGGGWDVTLTLPDGRRCTFGFKPRFAPAECKAYAEWNAPPAVRATLKALSCHDDINLIPSLPPYWQDGGDNSTYRNHDIPGWILTTLDGTQYYISRGDVNNVTWDSTEEGRFIDVQAYGPPALTKIVPRSGDEIRIGSDGISHWANGTNLTRRISFERDGQGRITAIYDPNAGSNGAPVIRYLYNRETGNLIQVLRLADRESGTYNTNKYHYDNSNFPHYITSIDDPRGIPLARNEYDDSGRLTAMVDSDGKRTEFIHSPLNQIETVVDRLGYTNIFVCDARGNITAATNAVGGVTLTAYDDANDKTNEVAFSNGQPYATNTAIYDSSTGLMLSRTDPIGHTNSFAYNGQSELTNIVDALGNSSARYYDEATGSLLGTRDALGNTATNFYQAGSGLLLASRNAIGTVTSNYYDSAQNLTATATLDASGILATNTFAYDADGNVTNSTVWRHVLGIAGWVGSTTTYRYDAQNRLTQTTFPDGGTNIVIYNVLGKPFQTIDKLGGVTSYAYDAQGRLVETTYPDGLTESSVYDGNGNWASSTDRGGRVTTYIYDGLNRLVQTVFPDSTTNTTVYDDLGRVRLTVDARGVTNAFGYDLADRRVAVTNALGTSAQMTNGFTFDANGNEITLSDARGHNRTNVFDALNQMVQVWHPDGTKTLTGFDGAGRRVAETNQDGAVMRFVFDGAGRLASLTDALSNVTSYAYDEAGNQTNQVDALGHQTRFEFDSMGQRSRRILPDGQAETMGYDLAGNLIRRTNFNGVVITNQYDVLNRLTNRSSANGYQIAFAYSLTGQRTNMLDPSGSTAYEYDNRDRLVLKTTSWSGGPVVSLNYAYDADGNLTNLWSGTSGGVTNAYQYDPLRRITNVFAGGSATASYGFDPGGNLQSVHYGNGLTNLWQYDVLNRLTNSVWKSNQLTLASFYYQLGLNGIRTNLTETILTGVTNRAYAWSYDAAYRLTAEAVSGIGSTSYGLDKVGNRTNRTAGLDGLPAQSFSYTSNDWLVSDAYDPNGNTIWTTNGATVTGPYYYDAENRLTNFNNSIYLGYNGDGIRVRKTANGTNFFYLVDDRNPSGYAEVLEEWVANGSATNLNRVYNYGLSLISQQQGATVYYFICDGHGSTRLLVDGAGSAVNAFTYDAYGNLISSNLAPQTAFLYGGEQFDGDLGMYYLRARYLNAGTGRFWTADSFEGVNEDPFSLHKYLYCQVGVMNRLDPTGHGFMIDLMISACEAAGLDAADAMSVCILINRVTFTFFELATGQTVVGAGVAGAGAGGGILLGKAILTKVEGGAATWIRTLKSSGQTWFGPQSYLSQVLRYSGIEANHLNQSGAYKVIVKEGGACIGLQGKAAVGQASEHGQFHAVLERFWDQFRTGGSKEGQQVANGGYLDALREALTAVKDKTTNAAKFTKDQIENWVQMAEKEQRGNGYHDGPGGLRPEVPRSTGAQ